MADLYPESLITVIAAQSLETTITKRLRDHHVSGYTIVRARGAGGTGTQDWLLDFDSNVQISVVMPHERRDEVLDELQALINRGHHLTVYVSTVEVLNREKFNRSLE